MQAEKCLETRCFEYICLYWK